MNTAKKQTLENVKTLPNDLNCDEDTYMEYFMSQLKQSEDDIKNGRVITLEELDREMEKMYQEYLKREVKQSEDDMRNGRVMTIKESKERMIKKYEGFNVG